MDVKSGDINRPLTTRLRLQVPTGATVHAVAAAAAARPSKHGFVSTENQSFGTRKLRADGQFCQSITREHPGFHHGEMLLM